MPKRYLPRGGRPFSACPSRALWRGLRFSVAPQKFPTHMVARKRDPPVALSTGRDALLRVRERKRAGFFPSTLPLSIRQGAAGCRRANRPGLRRQTRSARRKEARRVPEGAQHVRPRVFILACRGGYWWGELSERAVPGVRCQRGSHGVLAPPPPGTDAPPENSPQKNSVPPFSGPSVFAPMARLFRPMSPGLVPKIFSNHWKTGEKFFQSLEKIGGIFQPLEKSFPIIGQLFRKPRAAG